MHSHRHGDNIKMDLWDTWWEVVDCMSMVGNWSQWRSLILTAMNLRDPQINLVEGGGGFCDYLTVLSASSGP